MRSFAGLGVIAALFLSGCQHIQLTPNDDAQAAQNRAINPLVPMLSHLKADQGSSLHDYATACIQKSRLTAPSVVGNIIHTPNYALVTLQKNQQAVMGGELCIVNKITHRIEVTAVDDLQFLQQTGQTTATAP